jgi:phosphopantothenoylcysteine decarboxylase/phosphopantothenate--cysteine ligase
MGVLTDKKIVLVVTGGIAAYKSAELARLLVRAKAQVRVAMTAAARQFITPLTMQTLTLNPVAYDLWSHDQPYEVGHISLADWAQAVLIAPATANIIGKLAGGLADDFVSTFLLATRAPILICPAMNVNMYEHPAVQENMARLKKFATIIEPDIGDLACGWQGRGRLPDPAVIVEELERLLSPHDLAGLTVMVTAGPTREAWDAIRYISNRSTGQMGLALARTAWLRGAKVILVNGPVNFAAPYGIETIAVESTRDMRDAVLANLDRVDILVKAAAPGDFRPACCVPGKIKKGATPPPIELERNPDILQEVGPIKGHRIVVGFAAESENLLQRAKEKLDNKNLDLIVANQIGLPDEAFGAATNRVWIIDRQGRMQELPLMGKEEVAHHIWNRAVGLACPKSA